MRFSARELLMRLRKTKTVFGTHYMISMLCACNGKEQLNYDYIAQDYLPRGFIAADLWAIRAAMREAMKRHAIP